MVSVDRGYRTHTRHTLHTPRLRTKTSSRTRSEDRRGCHVVSAHAFSQSEALVQNQECQMVTVSLSLMLNEVCTQNL